MNLQGNGGVICWLGWVGLVGFGIVLFGFGIIGFGWLEGFGWTVGFFGLIWFAVKTHK